MNEQSMRDAIEAHAAAVVDPIDVPHIEADLIEELHPAIPAIAALLPQPVTDAAVTDLTFEGERGLATIVYSGDAKRVTVSSVWEHRGDRPRMVEATPQVG